MDINPLDFDLPKHRSSAIKVVGVGGGGSNAVNYMKNQGIRGVDFIICNTDAQALTHSPVETKIQLGATLTEGLGAGANPEVGEQAALESYAEIQAALGTQTKMVFITAGMGGGTGTGAAPIIAKASREMGILTVGIVTAPFGFEGNMRLRQAELGIERLRENVDSLIVINNNKLREVYGNLGFKQGFMKADEVLSTAARGIAEVITHHYSVNIDLRDAKTVLHNSGTAIMGSAKAAGSTRALTAVRSALDSPLLNDNHIVGARYVLLLIVSGSGEHEVTLDEIGEINDFIQEQAGRQVDIIMGIGEDPHLSDALQVTVIATGFSATNPIGTVKPAEPEKVVYELKPDTNPGSQFNLFEEPVRSSAPIEPVASPVDAPLAVVEPEVETPLSADDRAYDAPFAEDAPDSEVHLVVDIPTHEVPFAVDAPDTEGAEDPHFDATEQALTPDFSDEFTAEPAPEFEMTLGEQGEDVTESDLVVELQADEPAPTMTWTLDWDDDSNDPFAPKSEHTEDEEAVAMEWSDDVALAGVEELAEEPFTAATELSPSEADEFDVLEMATPALETAPTEPEAPARKPFSLDDLLAFEAQLRGDQPEAAAAAPSIEDSPIGTPDAVELPHPSESLTVGTEASISPFQAEPEATFVAAATPQVSAPEIRVEVREPAAERQTVHIDPDRDSLEDTMRRMAQERRAYLQAYSHRFGQTQQRIQQGDMDRPAFERQGWDLDASTRYSEEKALGEHMVRGDKNDLEFRPHNSFLHDNVD